MTSPQISAFPPDEAPRPARACAVTGKIFEKGEKVYAAIFEEDGEIKRRDLCADAWKASKGADGAIAWWSYKSPGDADPNKNASLAPNDALAALFEALSERDEQPDLRYALALLLVRRRVFRFEFDDFAGATKSDEPLEGPKTMYVYSSRNDAGYVVPIVQMDAESVASVQERLLAIMSEPNAGLDALTKPRAGADAPSISVDADVAAALKDDLDVEQAAAATAKIFQE